MEINQINNHKNPYINEVIGNEIKSNNVGSSSKLTTQYPSDILENNSSKSANSNFMNNISSNIGSIRDLQVKQNTISSQLEITTEIVKVTNSANNSTTIQLDDKQPKIQELFDRYNDKSKKHEGFDKEGIFFDGILGARPLSAQEIVNAVSQQNEKLYKKNSEIGSEIDTLVSQTKKDIEIEVKVDFKNVDFSKESSAFTASNINTREGSLIPSQANSFPSHAETLLS